VLKNGKGFGVEMFNPFGVIFKKVFGFLPQRGNILIESFLKETSAPEECNIILTKKLFLFIAPAKGLLFEAC
jgi:hypothetical protein